MAELPRLGTAMYLVHTEESNYRSRLESVEGDMLTVAAPLETDGAEAPRPGQTVEVFWAQPRARVILPCKLVEITDTAPYRWTLQPIDAPQPSNRREFVRGGGGPAVQLAEPPEPEPFDDEPFDAVPFDAQALATQALGTQALGTEALATQALATQALATQAEPVLLDGRLLDISEGGLRCQVPDKPSIKVGDPMSASLRLDTGDVEVTGTVHTVREAYGSAGYEVILIFRTDEITAQLIRQHVFTSEIAERRREADAS